MENQLQIVIKNSGLDTAKANALLENFSNYYEIASEWEKKSYELVVTDISQVAEMKLAREGRLFLKEKRILIEKTRKQLKESSLREGQAIDAIAKMLTNLILPIEENLEEKEKFKEREEKRLKQLLRDNRFMEIEEYKEYIPHNIDLSDLTEVAFNTIKAGAKAQHEAKLEEIKRYEEEQEKLRRIEELAVKRKSRLVNDNLWHLMDDEMKALNLGTLSDKYYDGLYEDLVRRRLEHEKESARIREENDRVRKEKEELEKKLIAEREIAEKERAKLNAEIEKKEKEFREAQRLQQLAEEKARKEAQKLAKAPIKKQLKVWVESFDIADCPVHDQIGVDIIIKFEAFKKWAINQVDNI